MKTVSKKEHRYRLITTWYSNGYGSSSSMSPKIDGNLTWDKERDQQLLSEYCYCNNLYALSSGKTFSFGFFFFTISLPSVFFLNFTQIDNDVNPASTMKEAVLGAVLNGCEVVFHRVEVFWQKFCETNFFTYSVNWFHEIFFKWVKFFPTLCCCISLLQQQLLFVVVIDLS